MFTFELFVLDLHWSFFDRVGIHELINLQKF